MRFDVSIKMYFYVRNDSFLSPSRINITTFIALFLKS